MERELLLLGLLRQQDMHGYQLHDFIDSYMQTCVDIKKSTAYYLLDKMAQQGLIEQTEEREGNRPTRRVYSLTPEGEALFQDLLRQNLSQYIPAQFAGDVGLTFLDELPPEEAVTLLKERRARMAVALNRMQQTPSHSGALQYMIEHQLAHLSAELAWLDAFILRLESQAPTENQEE